MRNLYLDLDAGQSSSKSRLAEALMDLRETDKELFEEAEEILLNTERKAVYDAVNTQYHAYAELLQTSSEHENSSDETLNEIAATFVDTHQWPKRLVEF